MFKSLRENQTLRNEQFFFASSNGLMTIREIWASGWIDTSWILSMIPTRQWSSMNSMAGSECCITVWIIWTSSRADASWVSVSKEGGSCQIVGIAKVTGISVRLTCRHQHRWFHCELVHIELEHPIDSMVLEHAGYDVEQWSSTNGLGLHSRYWLVHDSRCLLELHVLDCGHRAIMHYHNLDILDTMLDSHQLDIWPVGHVVEPNSQQQWCPTKWSDWKSKGNVLFKKRRVDALILWRMHLIAIYWANTWTVKTLQKKFSFLARILTTFDCISFALILDYCARMNFLYFKGINHTKLPIVFDYRIDDTLTGILFELWLL